MNEPRQRPIRSIGALAIAVGAGWIALGMWGFVTELNAGGLLLLLFAALLGLPGFLSGIALIRHRSPVNLRWAVGSLATTLAIPIMGLEALTWDERGSIAERTWQAELLSQLPMFFGIGIGMFVFAWGMARCSKWIGWGAAKPMSSIENSQAALVGWGLWLGTGSIFSNGNPLNLATSLPGLILPIAIGVFGHKTLRILSNRSRAQAEEPDKPERKFRFS